MSELSPLLNDFTTFGVAAKAKSVHALSSKAELHQFLKSPQSEYSLFLGQGSNVLFSNDYPYAVALVRWKGKQVKFLSDSEALLIASAGEPWHELVMWSLNQGLGGLENLALIPGSTGAAPIQNIGAYGVELKDVFEWCKAVHRTTLVERTFDAEECGFGYRESIFKNELKDQYVLTEVALRLSRNAHRVNTSYSPLQQWFDQASLHAPISPLEVAEAVCSIRRSKLPDPKVFGNAGSFFKNPVISAQKAKELSAHYPETPLYPQANGSFKVAAGWLIDRLNLKGFKMGKAAVHEKQALVLINSGGASGREILDLSAHIKKSVAETYGIELEEEVTIY
ncbi:MAG: UDP-N-acetylmuramate dehydrogenase [Flavobacteriaceae bacterium]